MYDLTSIIIAVVIGIIFYDQVAIKRDGYQPKGKPKTDILYPPKGGSNVGYLEKNAKNN